MVQGLARRRHGAAAALQELQHRGWHLGLCKAVGSRFLGVRQHAHVGQIEIHNERVVDGADPDKLSDRGRNLETDQFHRLLQLIA